MKKTQHSKDSSSSKSLHKMQIPHILLLEAWNISKTQSQLSVQLYPWELGEGCLHTSISLHIQRPLYNCFINYSWPLRKRIFKLNFFLKSLLLINVQFSYHRPLFSQVKFSLEQKCMCERVLEVQSDLLHGFVLITRDSFVIGPDVNDKRRQVQSLFCLS